MCGEGGSEDRFAFGGSRQSTVSPVAFLVHQTTHEFSSLWHTAQAPAMNSIVYNNQISYLDWRKGRVGACGLTTAAQHSKRDECECGGVLFIDCTLYEDVSRCTDRLTDYMIIYCLFTVTLFIGNWYCQYFVIRILQRNNVNSTTFEGILETFRF